MYKGEDTPSTSDWAADDTNITPFSCDHLQNAFLVADPKVGEQCCDVDKRKIGTMLAQVYCLFVS